MDPDKFLDRKAARPERDEGKRKRRKSLKMSQAQEKRVAARLGGETQAGSGSGKRTTTASGVISGPVGRGRTATRKGDVDAEAADLLVECKATAAKSISVKRAYLEKITYEAADAMRSPGLVISFDTAAVGVDRDWACVPLGWLRALMRKAGGQGLE